MVGKDKYAEYVESGSWCCGKAPLNKEVALQVTNNTGAHHWVKVKTAKVSATLDKFYCKYCFDVRAFPIHISFKEGADA